MAEFLKAFQYMIANEVSSGNPEGLVEDVDDSGGLTKYGISRKFLLNYKPDIKTGALLREIGFPPVTYSNINTIIKQMTLPQAQIIFQDIFWEDIGIEQISSQSIASYLFDAGVNHGPRTAIKMCQRALWAILGSHTSIACDGLCGPKTTEIINKTSNDILLPILQAIRAELYIDLITYNRKLSKYMNGWLKRAYRRPT